MQVINFQTVVYLRSKCFLDVKKVRCKKQGDGEVLCLCPIGSSLEECERQKQVCNPNPCYNDGICVKEGYTFKDFKCICLDGFTGDLCEAIVPTTTVEVEVLKNPTSLPSEDITTETIELGSNEDDFDSLDNPEAIVPNWCELHPCLNAGTFYFP